MPDTRVDAFYTSEIVFLLHFFTRQAREDDLRVAELRLWFVKSMDQPE